MKNLYKKYGVLVLLVCLVIAVRSQPLSYKKLTGELQKLQVELVPDTRQAILDIELRDTLQPVIVIFGETNLPGAIQQVVNFLNERKISFVDSIRVLPDEQVGDKTWALVNLSVANLRAKPGDASELVSQVLLGTPLKILDYKNTWYRVQTPEYYIGYLDSGGLKTLTTKEMDNWKKADRWIFNRSAGFIYNTPDYLGEIVSDVVLGDLFEVEGIDNGWLKMRFPDGRTGFANQLECLQYNQWINLPVNANQILLTGRQMMGLPYLWGGTSTKGVDCSGFVKTTFYAQGVILARDASQQARYGEPVDFSKIETLQPGDLLFFGRSAQRITHVGIYIADGDFIHSSGRVHIGSIIPGNPKNDPGRNLVAVRRICNSIDKEGITSVKNHQWYNP
jgi:hypothetical protein